MLSKHCPSSLHDVDFDCKYYFLLVERLIYLHFARVDRRRNNDHIIRTSTNNEIKFK